MLQNKDHQELLTDLKELVGKTKSQIAIQVNSAVVILYWEVGKRISKVVLGNRRAKYGKEVIVQISKQLTFEFGSPFSEKKYPKNDAVCLCF